MKKFLMAATAVASMIATPAMAQTGNGGPSGAHYSLNIIGVENPKTNMKASGSGHVIFVPLWGNSKIMLAESTDGSFQVLDKDGTDGTARFMLPDPDPEADGTTVYSVFARALGKPGGTSTTTTCGTDATDEIECSEISMILLRSGGKQSFTNVSKYLLYVYADIDEDGTVERVPLFGDGLEDYYWDYENSGLRLAQLRFYPCSSTVPDATNSGGDTTTSCY